MEVSAYMKNPSSYLKMRVLGAIESAPGKTQGERVRNVANMIFIDEYGEKRQFTWRTIYTWFYRYKNHGITGINQTIRKDKGITRKINPEELLEAINQVKAHFRGQHYNKMALYRKAIELGILRRNEIAQTTFYRFIREYELMKDDSKKPERLAFAMQYANQLWQGDTMFGPYVKNSNGKPVQSKLIAFIDDASRVICHGEFFLQENTESLITALRKAFYKRGIPEQLYVDNGSVYSSKEITLICARIGCILSHTPVRDGAAKGKIERFFRTVRLNFLSRELNLSSLENLNLAFTQWVEDEYNHKHHSTLGMKPIDRYALDRSRIRYLPNINANDELFYVEQDRTVINTNTFSFRGIIYEAPVMLSGKKIQIRFDRKRNDSPVIVFYKNQRMGEARPVDYIANGNIKNKNIKVV
jgi:transposase InsO family protein